MAEKILQLYIFMNCLPVLESNANIFAQGNSNGIVSVATVKAEYHHSLTKTTQSQKNVA